MEIRSLTLFDQPGRPVRGEVLLRAAEFADSSRKIFQDAGLTVQTLRFATPPFPTFLAADREATLVQYASDLESTLDEIGFEYLALGPALPSHLESYLLIPDLIHATQQTFCSGLLTDPEGAISLPAVRACGEVVQRLAPLDPNGFANLYFAALAVVPPGAPFFPAAYHGGEQPLFAAAVQGADLAVKAFQQAESLSRARSLLENSLAEEGQRIARAAGELSAAVGIPFGGIDFSLAPFPEKEKSLGTALEALGIPRLGDHGSTAAAAFLADTVDRADFPRTGFSGLMIPVLEDAVLADRAALGALTLKDLLLFSTVCGTGLDTVPLPGAVTPDQISAVLLDMASLAVRLDKPLTARLMPIPGKSAGEETSFDFPYFANSRVMEVQAEKLENLFKSDSSISLAPRKQQ